VELSNRSEAAVLVVRKQAGSDRRCIVLELSPRGREKLAALSIDHARELDELAPTLIRTLTRLRGVHRKPGKRAARSDNAI
jgi:DNA-binding MarR family transcriptional regulator